MNEEEKNKKIDLTIVVPFKNEETRIEKTIKDIIEFEKKKNLRIEAIFADSHSNDGTLDIIKRYEKQHDFITFTQKKDDRRGKGQAIQDGIFAAQGEMLLFMDADSSTEIFEADKLLPFINDYDVVMGSRYITKPKPYRSNYMWGLLHGIKSLFEVLIYGYAKDSTARGKQGRIRAFISRGGNLAFTVLLNQSYVDQRCGFKLYKIKIARLLAGVQTVYGFGFDTEYLAVLQKYKIKTIEVPVVWYDHAENTRLDPVKDSIDSFKDIFRVQKNLLLNKYSRKKSGRKLEKVYGENLLKK